MLKNLRQQIANIISPVKNTMSLDKQFLKYGSKVMTPDWTQVVMSDKDLYTGYPFAAIRKRANATARVALEYVVTKAEGKKEGFIHPHLEAITKSPSFSDYQFWYNISTYLDLEGVFYLLVVRNYEVNRYGAIKEFKLLNPYNVRRVVKEVDGGVVVGGYIETRKGFIREIPPEQIIEMRDLNPFDENDPYSMTDAAKESQFTIKTAGDYTRHTLKHNINAPGILSTDVILEDTQFANFVSRVKNNIKGEPIFGNGKGAIDWNSMNIDLSKSALKEVNELNREVMFAVLGMSKTSMGIEQSGVTRESSKVQKDLFNEGEILPRIQTIIDPMNQDYRNNYPDEYKSSKAIIKVENPNATDHDAEIKGIEAKQKKSDLYNGLIEKGYDQKKVADYCEGKIDIDQLGVPKEQKTELLIDKKNYLQHDHSHDQKKNDLVVNQTDLEKAQESSLENTIINIDQNLVAECIKKIEAKNDYESESDIVSKSQKNDSINELEAVLVIFYGIMMQYQGSKVMQDRMEEFAMIGQFTLDSVTKNYIKDISKAVAESHVETVVNDVLTAARDAALRGLSQKEIINEIRQKYNRTISETRAKTIARTETNRAFTRAQFEADRQFIKQNKLSKKAYKQWETRSDNACEFCKSLEKRGPILFKEEFAKIGDEIEVDGKSLTIGFEDLEAGNAHPNCSCIYRLIIKD